MKLNWFEIAKDAYISTHSHSQSQKGAFSSLSEKKMHIEYVTGDMVWHLLMESSTPVSKFVPNKGLWGHAKGY